jgi:hypothetical protein
MNKNDFLTEAKSAKVVAQVKAALESFSVKSA